MRVYLLIFIIFYGIFVLGATHKIQAATVQLNIAYADSEQPPYIYGKGVVIPEAPGVVVEMIRMLQDRIPGIELKLSRLSWKRCLSYLKAGKVDGIFNGSFSPERLKNGAYPMKNSQVDPSKRLVTISYGIYVLKNSPVSWDGKTLKNLNGGIVGANRGFSVVRILKKMGVPVEEVEFVSQNFYKLSEGRIAAVLAQNVTALSLLSENQNRFSKIVQLETPFLTKPYFLMLSHQLFKTHPKVAKQIWPAIEAIRNENFQNLIKKDAMRFSSQK